MSVVEWYDSPTNVSGWLCGSCGTWIYYGAYHNCLYPSVKFVLDDRPVWVNDLIKKLDEILAELHRNR